MYNRAVLWYNRRKRNKHSHSTGNRSGGKLKAKDKTKSNDFIRWLLKTSSKEVEGTNAGLIDCEYALEIYDEYSKSYTKGEKTVEKLENNEAVPDYSDQADIVVERLWSRSKHKDIIKESIFNRNLSISKNNISFMAQTAVATDIDFGSKSCV